MLSPFKQSSHWPSIHHTDPEDGLSPGAKGFTSDDIESLAKIIISANTSSRPSTAAVDPLFDFFFSGTGLAPGVRPLHHHSQAPHTPLNYALI